MTDAEFLAWCLQDGAQRTVLVELDYRVETDANAVTNTLYLSNRPYIDNATPRAYDECVKSVPDYERSLTGGSLNSYQVSYGTLELANPDGAHDSLLRIAGDASEVRVYAGDASWPVADFRLIFACLIARVEAPAIDRLAVYLKDASLLINKSIGGEVMVGGDGPNAQRARPVVFGSINQAPCFAQDDATLTYVYADSYDIIVSDPSIWETVVRDRGVSVDYIDNADGSFSLIAAPDGEITADVMAADGDFAGNRCVSDAVNYFIGERAGLNALSRYDGPGPTYDTRPDTGIADWIDAGGEDYLIGVELMDRRNAIQILNDLTETGNCSWACTRLGNLTLGRLRPFDISSLGVTPKRSIVEDDIDDGTLRIAHAAPTYYRLNSLGSKNWQIVSDLADVLTPEERDHLTRPGLTVQQDLYTGASYADSPQSYHLSMSESPVIETLLSGFNDLADLPRQGLWMDTRRGCLLPWLETVTLRTGMDRYDHEIFDVVSIDFTKSGRELFDPALQTQVVRIKISLTSWKIELGLFFRREGVGDGEPPVEPPQPPENPGTPAIASPWTWQQCSLNPVPCILTQGFVPFCPLEINCGEVGGGGPGGFDWLVDDGAVEITAPERRYGVIIPQFAPYYGGGSYDVACGLQAYFIRFPDSETPPADPAADIYWLATVGGSPTYADVYVGDIAHRETLPLLEWEDAMTNPNPIGVNDGGYVIYLWWGLDPSGSLLNGDSFSDPPWGAPPDNTRPFSSSTVSMQAYLTADDTPYGNPVVFTEQEP